MKLGSATQFDYVGIARFRGEYAAASLKPLGRLLALDRVERFRGEYAAASLKLGLLPWPDLVAALVSAANTPRPH